MYSMFLTDYFLIEATQKWNILFHIVLYVKNLKWKTVQKSLFPLILFVE